MSGVGMAAFALTLFDAWATYFAVTRGYAIEGNPILAAAIVRWGVADTMLYRATFGAVGIVVLEALGLHYRSARFGVWLIAVVMSLLAGWHLAGIVNGGF